MEKRKTNGFNRVEDLLSFLQKGTGHIYGNKWSFIFLGGQYSHATIKKPKAGDFRVQQVFAGTVEIVSPEPIVS